MNKRSNPLLLSTNDKNPLSLNTLICFLSVSVAILFLFSCATTSKEEILKESKAHYKIAISHMNEGNYQPAFVELQKTIKLNPDDKRAYYALGLIYHYFEDIEKSEESLKKAINLDPHYSEAYNSLGVVYTKTRRWDEAVKLLIKAIENPLYLSPEKAFANLGKVYYRTDEFEKALIAYKNAIKRSPDFHTAYYGLALCYNALKRYGDASEALTEAIKLDPLLNGNREKAKKEFTRQKLKTEDTYEEQDYRELLEILNY